jgi:hypothetical protein
MTAPSYTSARELDSRVSDGIHVRLLWEPRERAVWVAVSDRKLGGDFCMQVHDPGRALEVFHHPYAYAAEQGIEANASAGPAMSVPAPA